MNRCTGCGRPSPGCWCRFVSPVDVQLQLVVLQHPVEARHPLSTVPVVTAVIRGTVVHRGIIFADGTVPPGAALLYPGGAPPDPAAAPRVLVVLDGTWTHVRRMLRDNPWLADLPRIGVRPTGPSSYPRAQPMSEATSTIEAVALALVGLGEPAAVGAALLRPFAALVGMHQACADGGGSHVLGDPDALVRAGYLPAG